MQTHIYWGVLVALYLFLAGGGAGAIFISSFFVLQGSKAHLKVAKLTCIWGCVALILGVSMILLDLTTLRAGFLNGDFGLILRFYKLFITFVPSSIMSWGTWILTISIPVALFFMLTFYDKFNKFAKTQAKINMLFAIAISSYTAFLLGDVAENLVWNNSVLVVLFISSALSSGVAILILVKVFSSNKSEDENLSKIDFAILCFELICILIYIYTVKLALGHNGYEFVFNFSLFSGKLMLIGAIFIGILMPIFINLNSMKKKNFSKSQELLLAICLLVGAFSLRYSVLLAGQI